MRLEPEFLMSIDAECLTAVPEPCGAGSRATILQSLLDEIAGLAPSLPGPSGLFTGYGRIYIDAGHVELAAAECTSPYEVPLMLERLQILAARGAERLRNQGVEVLLATCTHGGRLGAAAPSWGAHENYLIGVAPERLADRLLPFLVTRTHAGAGAIWAPTGEFLAGARMTALASERGGTTMEGRAIFSTARQEHHAGHRRGLYRCHLILGDGHRSQFSLALQLGTTALVLRAVEALPDRVLPIPRRAGQDQGRFWLAVARRLNRLSATDGQLLIHPLVLDVQQFYLDLAMEFVATLSDPPEWPSRLLGDWRETLSRLHTRDEDWLSARLDPWIKHRLFTAWLAERGASWEMVRSRPELIDGLAVLDQDYHTFSIPENLFDRLEDRRLVDHRTGPKANPGDESEPFVPDVATRAKARARFIVANSGNANLLMDWAGVMDGSSNELRWLEDPFAAEFGPWQSKTL
jgi:hypothetical protein